MDTKDYSASAMMAAVDIAGILHVATIQIVIDPNIRFYIIIISLIITITANWLLFKKAYLRIRKATDTKYYKN